MMINHPSWRHSLKNRVTLITLAIFLAGIWSLAFYASHTLREDMKRQSAEQQYSMVSFIATEVNEQLSERLQALETVAKIIAQPSDSLEQTEYLQTSLEHRPVLQQMFNGGTFVTRLDGTATASTPPSAKRVGVNYMDRDYIIAAIKDGKSTVGQPIIGRKLLVPVFVMAAPIRNAQGKVIGALAGVTDLSKHNFLSHITENRYGKNGGYFLVASQHRQIVTATDKSRMLQQFPTPGINPSLDRYIQGYEGSAIYVNPFGVEVLGSGKKIPAANWIMGATLPTNEAFAPIQRMQLHVLLATLLLTLMAGGLTWWTLRRQLLPILAAAQTISAMAAGDQPPQALTVTSKDEIGTLISGFNRLLESLTQRATELKESDGRAAALIESSPLPLALNDENGNITYLNQAFIKTIGYTLNDIPTLEKWWPLAYPDPQYRKWVADSWQKNLDDAKHTNQAFAPLEISILCKDGLTRSFMASASAFEGSFSKTHLVILFDVTESKKTEQALIASSNRLSEAQQLAHIGNWSADMASGELHWSDEIYRIFGHQPGSFAPSVAAFKAAIHPDDVTLVENSEKQAQLTGRHDVVHRIVRPDGSVRYVHELAKAETDAAGKLVRLSGTVQDITETKLAELSLVSTTNRLNEAQLMAKIGNWSLNLTSGELIWSDEIFRIFEIDPDKFGATYEAFLNAIHPDDRDAVNQAYTNSLETRTPYEITHRLRMSDGRIKWVVEKCMSDFDAAGKPLQSRGMVQDITAVKLTELALTAARDEADRANQAKSEFLSSMSHELRTPMNGVLGFAQLLQLSPNLTQQDLSNVDEILNAGNHLLELINDVLDLAKIESGHIDLLLESVEACSIVEECLRLVDSMAEKRNIHLSHTGLGGARVRIDRTRTKQALLNLLTNAIKYNREGGSVHIEGKPHGNNLLRILVTDTGVGINSTQMANLFQPFNRLGAENGSIEGTGIGLTITRRIIESMGGTADGVSEVGVGSTFWIELPLETAKTSNQTLH